MVNSKLLHHPRLLHECSISQDGLLLFINGCHLLHIMPKTVFVCLIFLIFLSSETLSDLIFNQDSVITSCTFLHFYLFFPHWKPNKWRRNGALTSLLSQLVTFQPAPAPVWKVTSSAPLQRDGVLLVHLTDCLFGSPEWTQGSNCSASRMGSQTDLRLLKHNHGSFIRMPLHNNRAFTEREWFVSEDSPLPRSGDLRY